MRVRLTETRVSNGHLLYAGEVIDVPDGEAWSLIKARQAEEVEPRSAMLGPARQAVIDRPKQNKMRGSKDAVNS